MGSLRSTSFRVTHVTNRGLDCDDVICMHLKIYHFPIFDYLGFIKNASNYFSCMLK